MIDHQNIARRLLGLLDLTNLDDQATQDDIKMLCERAVTPYGRVAAVCTWSRFVTLCAGRLAGSGVKVAAVANFPHGAEDIETAEHETWRAVSAGADEVDLVFPYRAWQAGRRDHTRQLVRACKEVCGREVLLKVILEVGVLLDVASINDAAEDAMAGGADFLKTSTGRTVPGATLPAAAAILEAIRNSHRAVGLKVSGGIRSPDDAADYLELAEAMMGEGWAEAQTFRIGASKLLDELLAILAAGS